jgi:hypothetical protein
MKMPYKELIKMYTERKSKLSELLNENTLGLNQERIYSIKGAVEEIDMFLNVLSQHQEEMVLVESKNDTGSLSLVEEAVLRDNEL